MLTCKDSEIETVLGLEMGADDYLSKPVRYHELMAFNILFREILAQDKDCISAWRDKITSKLDAIPDN